MVWGGAQEGILQPFHVLLVSSAGGQSISKVGSIPFIVHNVSDGSNETGIITGGHCPLFVHLPST